MEKRKGINCAECRRSKLKCDRKVPCSSCVKRGCPNICPDGVQAATKGIKLIAAQEENAYLRQRVATLEEALKQMQAHIEPLKKPSTSSTSSTKGDNDNDTTEDSPPEEDASGALSAFGHLTLGEEGESYYHGQAAQTEYLLKSKNTRHSFPNITNDSPSSLPPEILRLSEMFPLGPNSAPDQMTVDTLLSYIPLPKKAWELFDTYLEGTSWLIEPLSREEYLDQIHKHILLAAEAGIDLIIMHPLRLSLFFIICAIATLFDTDILDPVAAAEEWHHLSKAAASLGSLMDEPSIVGTKTVFLMVIYHFMWNRDRSERRWQLMGVASRLAQSVGLHRDPSRWNLTEQDIYHRRRLFWDIQSYDAWMSFAFGRPLGIGLIYVDCKFPEGIGKDEKQLMTPTLFKILLTSQLAHANELFSKTKFSYLQVLKLDRNIRKIRYPEGYSIIGHSGKGPDPSWAANRKEGMLKYRMLLQREAGLLQIHRPYFAQAMDDTVVGGDGKRDLLHARFAPSVLAVYRSSCLLIAGMRDLARAHPEPIRRWWFFWTTNYAAGIVLASLIIRCTYCHLASAALPVLDGVVSLFEEIKPMFAPANMMDILKRLQRAAHEALQSIKGQPNPHMHLNELELELPMLDGRTYLISRGRNKTPSSSTTASASQSPQAMSIRHESRAAFGDVHPAVLEYFNVLDGPSPPGFPVFSDTEMRYSQQTHTPTSSAAASPPVQQAFSESSEYWSTQWAPTYSTGIAPTTTQQLQTSSPPTGTHIEPMVVPQTTYNLGESFPELLPFANGNNGTNGAGEAVPMDLTAFNGDTSWNGLLDQLGLPQVEGPCPIPNVGWAQVQGVFGM